MAYQKKDHFYHKAKQENYSARSVYKLEEMDQKWSLFKKGMQVLDLGAAPGSWSEYALKKVAPGGSVVGVDLELIEWDHPNFTFIYGDFQKVDWPRELTQRKLRYEFDLIISDMAPKTTGVKIRDQQKSLELCQNAFDLTKKLLAKNGSFICKIFEGGELHEFRDQMKSHFRRILLYRPKSTRKQSKEIYLFGSDHLQFPG